MGFIYEYDVREFSIFCILVILCSFTNVVLAEESEPPEEVVVYGQRINTGSFTGGSSINITVDAYDFIGSGIDGFCGPNHEGATSQQETICKGLWNSYGIACSAAVGGLTGACYTGGAVAALETAAAATLGGILKGITAGAGAGLGCGEIAKRGLPKCLAKVQKEQEQCEVD